MIRLKNLDLGTDGMKGYSEVSLGDVTAVLERGVFVAPIACVVNFIDLYSGQGQAGQSSVAWTVRVQLAADSATAALVSRGTSATAGVTTSNDIVANSRYRLIPTANNSLTNGTPIEINFSQQGSAVLSAVICVVTYTPLVHRETR